MNKTHGLSDHPIYETWERIKTRCYNKKVIDYKNYGGRGIIMCKEWLDDFMNFYSWAIYNGWSSELSIDRHPNKNGNYEPTNCRWATRKEQNNNRRNTIICIYNRVITPISDISKTVGIKERTLRYRLTAGLTIEEAILLGKTRTVWKLKK